MDENPYRGPESEDGIASTKRPTSTMSKVLMVLMVLGIVGVAFLLLLPTVRTGREAARRNLCNNHLKQIAIALQNYQDAHDALPPAYTVDAAGKPLHSWRTLILPYLEERTLYESIDLTKPWDDPVNAKARETSLSVYQCPSTDDPDGNTTTYLAVVTPNSAIQADKPRRVAEITDGASKTLMVIEVDADHAVPWMSPVDADEKTVLRIGPTSKLAHPGGVHAAFVDSHVAFLREDLPTAQRRALISSAANDEVSDPEN
jgi:prepilin-type processing-associated H-X9-DG protein